MATNKQLDNKLEAADFNKMKLAELKDYAKGKNIEFSSNIKKEELVKLIEESQDDVSALLENTDENTIIDHDYDKLTEKELKVEAASRGIITSSNDSKDKIIRMLVRDDKVNKSKYLDSEEAQHTVVKHKNRALPLAIFFILLLVLISVALWFILTIQVFYVTWGVEDITFYSQLPYSGYGSEDMTPDSVHIDGGFNDSVYHGSYEYSKTVNNAFDNESPIGFAQSMRWSMNNDAYINKYWGLDAQYNAGAKTVISSGFNIATAYEVLYTMEGFTDADFKDNGWKSIVIDDNTLAMNHESATSVTFNAADAGFLAGIAGSVYTLHQNVSNPFGLDESELTDDLVTWGGYSFSTVYDWMSGFEQGINYFNYKVLGVDVNDEIHSPIEGETLGLISKAQDAIAAGETVDIANADDLADGIDLTNGFSPDDYADGTVNNKKGIKPDYTKSFYRNNQDLGAIDESNQNQYWYTGAFDSNPLEGSGLLAAERTQSAIDWYMPVIFPVAGGQTQISSTMITNQLNSYNKVIGVDVDGTHADVENASAYLGSATKNLKDASSLALWTNEGGEETSSFGGITGYEFNTVYSESNPKGWKVEEYTDAAGETQEYKGKQYIGTFENGGVDFVESTTLQQTYLELVNDLGLETIAPPTFYDFSILAFGDNDEIGIENSSATFTPSGTGTLTIGASAPWIPDWTIYVNTY